MTKQAELRERWRQRIEEQEQSGKPVRVYCKEHGVGEHSFYSWRVRLRGEPPVAFALVQRQTCSKEAKTLELVLSEGERLRIPCEEGVLRMVLEVLRTRA